MKNIITIAAAIALLTGVSIQAVQATPAYAGKTKAACTKCHDGAPSAESVNETGKCFVKNGKESLEGC